MLKKKTHENVFNSSHCYICMPGSQQVTDGTLKLGNLRRVW